MRSKRAGSWSRVGRGTPDVLDDLDVIDDDESFADELVELCEERSDAFVGVDDGDRDGEVVGERQDAGRVDVVGGAVAFNAAEHGRAGESGGVRALDDLGREWCVSVAVGFADEDGESLLVSLE